MQRILTVFDDQAARQKADDESVTAAWGRVELQTKEIVQAVNERRRADGLEPLGRATVQDYIREAVEAGSLEAVRMKAKPLYRLKQVGTGAGSQGPQLPDSPYPL